MEEPFEKGHFGGFDHGKWSGDEKKYMRMNGIMLEIIIDLDKDRRYPQIIPF